MKKSITLATSWKVPSLLIARRSTSCRIFSGGTDRIRSVSTGAGPTALHVMPQGASSRAITFVKVSTALFDAA